MRSYVLANRDPFGLGWWQAGNETGKDPRPTRFVATDGADPVPWLSLAGQ
jgi:hypothetical protein